MRMEELQNESFIKQPDTVERYLLNIVRQYFVDNATIPEISRESFINDALEVMKEEVDFDSLGVLSITLPSGETRIGDVRISLEDLDGEPKIPVKHTAFNVDFGIDAGTACEGNDPRLYDARTPIEHTHQISEIYGLEGILTSIQARIDSMESLVHEHTNKDLLDRLVYTGNKSIIDLNILDTLEEDVREAIEDINNRITACCAHMDAVIADINTQIDAINNRIADLITFVITENERKLIEIKEWARTKYIEECENIRTWTINNFASRSEFYDLRDFADNVYVYCATDIFNFSEDIAFSLSKGFESITLHLSEMIVKELAKRNQDIKEAQYDMYFKYIENDNVTKCPVPYMIYESYPEYQVPETTTYLAGISVPEESLPQEAFNDRGEAVPIYDTQQKGEPPVVSVTDELENKRFKGSMHCNLIIEGPRAGDIVLEFNCYKEEIPEKILNSQFVIDCYSRRPIVLGTLPKTGTDRIENIDLTEIII